MLFATNLSVRKCSPAGVAGLHAFPVPRGYFFFGVLGFAGFFFPCGFAGFCFLAISPPPFQADVIRDPLQRTLRDDIILQ